MRGDLHGRLFWPVYAPSILFGIAAGATVPVQVVAAIHLGASPSLAALVVAVIGAMQLLTTVHAGRFIDAVGDRRAMVVASVGAGTLELGSVAALMWNGSSALALFIATSVLRAPALNVWSLARQAFVADRVASNELGRAMTGLGGTMRIGTLVGPLLGSLLLLRLPLWSVYLLSVACAALALLVLHIPSLGGDDRRVGSTRATGPAAGGTEDDHRLAAGLTVDWTRVVLAGVAITCLAMARIAQPVVIQLWGVHSGLSPARISFLVAVGAAVEIVLMFPGGHLKDRLGRAVILVTCLVVYGGGFLLLVPLTDLLGTPGLVAAVVVMAIGNGLGAGVNMTIGGDLSPSAGRGRFLGVWALFSNVGGLSGPLLVSALVKTTTVVAAVMSIGGVALAGAAWMVVFAGRIGLPGGTGGRRGGPGRGGGSR